MHWLRTFRYVALSWTVVASLVVIALGVLLSLLAIVVGVLTLATVPVMLVVDYLRTGAVTSMVVVEFVWLSILWVLWLIEATSSSQDWSQAGSANGALEGFSFITWLILLAYTATLLVVAMLNAARGEPMWTSSLKQRLSAAPAQPGLEPQPGQQKLQAHMPINTPGSGYKGYPQV